MLLISYILLLMCCIYVGFVLTGGYSNKKVSVQLYVKSFFL